MFIVHALVLKCTGLAFVDTTLTIQFVKGEVIPILIIKEGRLCQCYSEHVHAYVTRTVEDMHDVMRKGIAS